jgi:MFS transporter, NNP family, nitrate/nitrite transporter
VLLVVLATLVWLYSPSPDRKPAQGRSMKELLAPLKNIQVWRFSLYYVVVFGAYVALSSWLPKYYVDHYGLSLTAAGLITALFIFPASLLRPLGGHLADKWGARGLMYFTFMLMLLACALLTLPVNYSVEVFTGLLLMIAVAMGIGKASVFKFIPARYPNEVGTVGGLVGAIGALGGFFLPLLFSYFKEISNAPQQSTFGILALLTVICLFWLHSSVLVLNRQGVRAS